MTFTLCLFWFSLFLVPFALFFSIVAFEGSFTLNEEGGAEIAISVSAARGKGVFAMKKNTMGASRDSNPGPPAP